MICQYIIQIWMMCACFFYVKKKKKHHKNPLRKHETYFPKNDLGMMLWCLMMSMVQLPLGKRMMTTIFSQHVRKGQCHVHTYLLDSDHLR